MTAKPFKALKLNYPMIQFHRRCLLLLLRIPSAHQEILGFPMVPTDAGILLHGLKLCWQKRTYKVLLVFIKIMGWGGETMHFSEIINL